ncbi:ABC transporter substrate-binding protein [Pseudoruegeria sp. SHC-113]|uniref:ABC transporter substrate-binding protein n=1 Tax=Pseudoruegeria sp. SHC-113 TaxID=2855439 RepID=UPI0021BB99AB|nr:sugar ABC transporter substrate-binding protein [Pseudoruegeria sp. SHC-113]MCT8161304.1 sugar ABC transporter substrate-binding protein [Pseudoruegeria sp. SHC-113]
MKRSGINVLLGATALSMAAGLAGAAEFDGITLQAKLIGGQQYEALYARIAEWEAATGATVEVISKKNHFELDKEFKSDLAAGTLGWCVGSNHSSFASQYPSLYTDLTPYLSEETMAGFVPANMAASKIGDALVMLPRAQFDVSALYYLKDIYEDEANKAAYKEKTGKDLTPPDTWEDVKEQAIFFTDAPNFYGTQYAGKDEAIVGRFYEMVVAEGGQLFNEDWSPAFNSDAGARALQWFVDLYEAGAVPPGTTSYLWDDLGQGFASGTIALNLDWPGWAGFFNGTDSSKAAGNVGVKVQPAGSSGARTGWSGHHGFSVTESCEHKEAAASLVDWLTNEDSQKLESAAGPLPTRTAVWEHVVASAEGDAYRTEVLQAFQAAASHAFPAPQTPYWIEATNLIYPELQAAILGDKSVEDALQTAADAVDELMQEEGVY